MRKLLTLCIALAAIALANGPVSAGWLPLAKPGGGGGGVTWAYKTSGNAASGASGTFTGVAIGTTVTSDIIVLVTANDVGVPTGVTIGGNPCTAVSGATDGAAVDQLTMWYLSGVTLGATSTIVITAGGGNLFNSGYMVGVISGSATPTPTTGLITAGNSNANTSISATIPTGGIGIAAMAINGNPGGSWSNSTQDVNLLRSSTNHEWLVHTAIETGVAIAPTYTGTGSVQNHLIMGV